MEKTHMLGELPPAFWRWKCFEMKGDGLVREFEQVSPIVGWDKGGRPIIRHKDGSFEVMCIGTGA